MLIHHSFIKHILTSTAMECSLPVPVSLQHLLHSLIILIWYSCKLVMFLMLQSVQLCHSVTSYSLQPHGLQHARPPCPSLTPGPCSNSCPLSWWCHPTISSSVVPFSSCLQSFPESGSFPMALQIGFSSSSHQVVKVLELQHQSFQWIFRTDFL